ncbi:winged helix-turn-helix transcriptional regulator [Nakamurella endophytica]|uniref:Transcriptional regulator n=1 Tax=Nakamurella endophytica TaxID=1748367 RepID=A0A917SWS2_9ACTN|nr:helix-turn-helix domain-containing protein [Nakamurella endophytica]GGM00193.1 transcriptional regulator [Nakamurella endophytica]
MDTESGTVEGAVADGRSVRGVLDRLGDKWTVLVVATLAGGPLRFGQLHRAVDGISQRMLTLTLRHLERDGMVHRTVHPEVPPRVEYRLTDLGRGSVPLLQGLRDWSAAHAAEIGAARAAFDGRHTASG